MPQIQTENVQQSINMYLIMVNLHKEAINASVQTQFLSNRPGLRHQRTKYKNMAGCFHQGLASLDGWQDISQTPPEAIFETEWLYQIILGVNRLTIATSVV